MSWRILWAVLLMAVLSERIFGSDTPAENEMVFSYQFEPEAPRTDHLRLIPDLVIQAPASIVEEGKPGGALKINAPIDSGENANYAQLSRGANEMFPVDAVTVGFDFCPDESLFGGTAKNVYLLDQMYTGNTGLQVIYMPPNDGLLVRVGNGQKILSVNAERLGWEAGKWIQITLTYDAATGELRLYENGKEMAAEVDSNFGPLNYGKHPFRIGNRLGSLYGNAPGLFDNVQMTRGVKAP